MSVIDDADRFAETCHAGVLRKYNGRPYISHPRAVAKMAAEHPVLGREMYIAAALLHDVVEDCGVTVAELESAFGQPVASVVKWLSNPSKGMNLPRAERKAIDREHAARMPSEIKILKLMDRLHNLREIDPEADPDFCTLYAEETALLLVVIGPADPELAQLVQNEVARVRAEVRANA